MIATAIILAGLSIGILLRWGILVAATRICESIKQGMADHSERLNEAIRTRRCGRGKVKFQYTIDSRQFVGSRPKPQGIRPVY